MRSKVEPMKEVAQMIRQHFDGIVAWTQTRQTNGFIEVIKACFKLPSARFAVTRASRRCAPSSFSSPASWISPALTRTPREPHYPLHFEEDAKFPRMASRFRGSMSNLRPG
ncbi:hypothetical protein OKW27_000392 [Paraburkholderia sp. 35.1]